MNTPKRTRKKKENAKRERIYFRVTDDFKKLLEDKAGRRDMKLTKYFEYLVMKDKPPKKPK